MSAGKRHKGLPVMYVYMTGMSLPISQYWLFFTELESFRVL